MYVADASLHPSNGSVNPPRAISTLRTRSESMACAAVLFGDRGTRQSLPVWSLYFPYHVFNRRSSPVGLWVNFGR